jgi:hypothetical protein
VVFAGWFLNYAGTEKELTSMFGVIAQNLRKDGKFVGVTTNAHDPWVVEDKKDFYGLDVDVLDKAYVAPDTGREVSPHFKPEWRFLRPNLDFHGIESRRDHR